MHIDAESPAAAAIYASLAGLVREAGGYISPDLVLHQCGSMLWASVAAGSSTAKSPSRLVLLPEKLLVPIDGLGWQAGTSLQPQAGLDSLQPLQRHALDLMLELFDLTGKMSSAERELPVRALASESALLALIRSGRPHWRPAAACTAEAFIGTRILGRQDDPAEVNTGGASREPQMLMPLLDVWNHHPRGAIFRHRPEGMAIRQSEHAPADQAYANYGYRDALSLLLDYGYVDRQPRFLQSIACQLELAGIGRLTIMRQGHSTPNDLPWFKVTQEGVMAGHINLDADQPQLALEWLRMLATGFEPGAGAGALQRRAIAAMIAILDANLDWYRAMLPLAAAAALNPASRCVAAMLLDVSEHQTALIEEIRGRYLRDEADRTAATSHASRETTGRPSP